MPEVSLSLICPTIGRSTLARLIEEVAPQLQKNDQFIIVADGEEAYNRMIKMVVQRPIDIAERIWYTSIEHVGDFGCSACDYAIEKVATGDFVFFIGDDDHVTPDTLRIVREGAGTDLTKPHLFAMMHTGGRLGNIIASCMVSGQQIVVPRDMEKMPKMADVPKESLPLSDYHFITRVQTAWGGVVMHDEVIAVLEKQHHGKLF